MNEYEKQAQAFLAKNKVKIEITFDRNGKYFVDDKEPRDIYKVSLKRENGREYTFTFGQSLTNSKSNVPEYAIDIKKQGRDLRQYKQTYAEGGVAYLSQGIPPTAYDILSCLTKYNPGSFGDFCSEFGYDTDSRKAEKVYRGVVEEWLHLSALFNEPELDELREIN